MRLRYIHNLKNSALKLHRSFSVAGGLLFVLGPLSAASAQSIIVPREAWISDFEVRRYIAEFLSSDSDRLNDSEEEYRALLEERPDNIQVQKGLIRVLIRLKKYPEALSSLEPLFSRYPDDKELGIELMRVYAGLDQFDDALALSDHLMDAHPENPELIMEVADMRAGLGHAKSCRDLYLRVLKETKDDQEIRLRFADRMTLWGDFYQAEEIYREYLERYPDDMDAQFKLAGILASAQRYEEAEGIYLSLLLSDKKPPASLLMKLSRLKGMEKDFQPALHYIRRLLALYPHNLSGLLFQGELLYRTGDYEKGLESLAAIPEGRPERIEALLWMGRIYSRQGRDKESREVLSEAMEMAPGDITVMYLLLDKKTVKSSSSLEDITGPEKKSPMQLVRWGRLYAGDGLYKIAVRLYEEALRTDPDSFPARMELAEVLGIEHHYGRAIEALKDLSEDFPENPKILISLARVLGWSREYLRSLALYKKVIDLNPLDPVPQREAARCAAWGKMAEEYKKFYEAIWEPTVDSMLFSRINNALKGHEEPPLKRLVRKARELYEKGSVYKAFEWFSENLEGISKDLSPEILKRIRAILLELGPYYRIQKTAYIESTAKRLSWENRFARSMELYETLIQIQPGNEEALFDYAQLQCLVGMCDQAEETYHRLLAIDPIHRLAGIALDSSRARRSPSVRSNFNFWEEKGRGELSQISRYRTDLALILPLTCRHRLTLTGHHWVEDPRQIGESRDAKGFGLRFTGVLSPYVRAGLGWTRKAYSDDVLEDRDNGEAHIWFNLRDYASLGLGFERKDELYNHFGIMQGTYSDNYWASVTSNLTQRLEIEVRSDTIDYKDDNRGVHHHASLGYAITDHPRIIKIIFSGEYRDTKKLNLFQYDNQGLVNIIHPYWTPKDYYSGAITLEWYHDLSRLFICGSDANFYDFRVTPGTDTEHNPFISLEGEWHYEFRDRWFLNVKGMVHLSREWDAKGCWLTLEYRF